MLEHRVSELEKQINQLNARLSAVEDGAQHLMRCGFYHKDIDPALKCPHCGECLGSDLCSSNTCPFK